MEKKAFTLIELIFSMVIIAIAFTVLPKMLQLATKSSKQNIKEEGLYNAVALMGLIQSTAWDEANTEYDDILLVKNGNSSYECDTTTGYRIGGFTGSRNCKNKQNASETLALESNDNNTPDDMDDFATYDAQNHNDSRAYKLIVSTKYVDDITPSETTFHTTTSSQSTNIKYITIDINATKKQSVLGEHIARFYYFSSNIGQMQVNKRVW